MEFTLGIAYFATGLVRVFREKIKPAFFQVRVIRLLGIWGTFIMIPFWLAIDLIPIIESGGRDKIANGELIADLIVFVSLVAALMIAELIVSLLI